MGGGRNHIREEAKRLSAAFGSDHHHVAVVAGRAAHAYARHHLVAIFHQRHAAGSHQRIVIGVDVGARCRARGARGRAPIRRGWRNSARVERRAPRPHGVRTVLPLQWSQCRWLLITISMDSGSMPWRAITSRQRLGDGRQFGALAAARIHLIAAAGFDQDGVLAGADHVTVEAERHAVELVGGGLAAPQRLRHHAEYGAAVPPVDRVADQGQFEIAHLRGADRTERRQYSTFDEFAAALEEVGGIIHQLAAAFEHVLAGIGDILAGGFHRVPALLGLIGQILARLLAALWGVKNGCRGANESAGQEPCEIARRLALRLVCFRAFVLMYEGSSVVFCDILKSWRKIPIVKKSNKVRTSCSRRTPSIWSRYGIPAR